MDNQAQKPQRLTLGDAMRIAESFAKSGYFKDAKTPDQCFTKIVAGMELNIGPMAAMSQIHIVEGKPTLDASLVGAKIKSSGRYDYRIKQSDNDACILEFFEDGKSVGESSFTMADAKQAGLAHRAVWKNYTRDMLRSRAITRGARMFCPDVFNGAIYTPEEIRSSVEQIDEAPEPVAQAVNNPSPQERQVPPTPEPDPPPAPQPEPPPGMEGRTYVGMDPLLKEMVTAVYRGLGKSPYDKDPATHTDVIAMVYHETGGIEEPPRWWDAFSPEILEGWLDAHIVHTEDATPEPRTQAETGSPLPVSQTATELRKPLFEELCKLLGWEPKFEDRPSDHVMRHVFHALAQTKGMPIEEIVYDPKEYSADEYRATIKQLKEKNAEYEAKLKRLNKQKAQE